MPKANTSMNPADFRAMRKSLGLSQVQLAKAIGYTDRNVKRWEAGMTIPEPVCIIMRLMKGNRSTALALGAKPGPVSIHEKLKAAGVPLDHHATDLYAMKTPVSHVMIEAINSAIKSRSSKTSGTAGSGTRSRSPTMTVGRPPDDLQRPPAPSSHPVALQRASDHPGPLRSHRSRPRYPDLARPPLMVQGAPLACLARIGQATHLQDPDGRPTARQFALGSAHPTAPRPANAGRIRL
jgi:transcriptional regulator with XRE-family HTH domain